MREGNNYERKNFKMEIIDEGALDKVLKFRENTLDAGKSWRKFYEVVDDGYFKQSYVDFPKRVSIKMYNIVHFL